MPRTNQYPALAGFIADPQSIDRSNGGRQIDWANVNVSYKDANGNKFLRAGTVVGDLLGTGKISPRVLTTNPAVGILETDARENDPAASKGGFGMIIGGVIYEALLPDSTGTPRVLPAAIKTELAAAGVSTGFVFVVYQDAR